MSLAHARRMLEKVEYDRAQIVPIVRGTPSGHLIAELTRQYVDKCLYNRYIGPWQIGINVANHAANPGPENRQ